MNNKGTNSHSSTAPSHLSPANGEAKKGKCGLFATAAGPLWRRGAVEHLCFHEYMQGGSDSSACGIQHLPFVGVAGKITID